MTSPASPEWVRILEETYLAGGSSMFILHGNVADVVGCQEGAAYTAEPLPDFLTRRLFGGYDLVLYYDPGRGLRPYAGGDARRLAAMNTLLDRILGERPDAVRDATQAFRLLDRLVSLLLVGADERARKTAVLFDYADFICPAEERPGENLATFLNWARSPVIRRVNLLFVLMSESLGRLHPALVQSGYTYEIAVPLPGHAEREAFIAGKYPDLKGDAARLAIMSAGQRHLSSRGTCRL